MKLPHINIKSFRQAHEVRNLLRYNTRNSVSATDLAKIWDYKSAGFSRYHTAIDAFNKEFNFLNDPSRQRSKLDIRKHPERRDPTQAMTGRILDLLRNKRAAEKADDEWLGTFNFVKSIAAIQAAITDSIKNKIQDPYGEWARSGMLLNDGSMLVATFSTCTEWTGKNDKWPHKTRSIEVEIFSAPRLSEKWVSIPSRSGNWMQSAAIELLKPRSGKVNNINLHEKVRAKPAGSRCGIKFYKRTVAGETLDFVAVIDKNTFHSATKRLALAGLAKKINGKVRAGRLNTLNYKLCRDLGFCNTGIAEFCNTFGLDIDSSYSRQRIARIISGDPRADRFSYELKKVGVI